MPGRRATGRWPVLLALLLATVPACAGDGDWPVRALEAVNTFRVGQGLPPLRESAALQAIAVAHSEHMAVTKRLTHEGFQARFDRTDSLLCVENVATGTLQPAQLVGAWSRATRHRRNLLEPRVRQAGIAAAGGYVTLFACE